MWEIAGIACGIVVALIGGINAWLIVNLRASIAELKVEMNRAREEDSNKLRDWINGSFLRSKEAIANQRVIEVQLADLKRERDSDIKRIMGLERRYADIQG